MASQTKRAPKHDCIKRDLREKILSRVYDVGSRIPNEMELCEHYGVSRATVRQAILALVADGLLVRTRKRGTYVCDPFVPRKPERGNKGALALVVPGFDSHHPYAMYLVNGMQKILAPLGYHLIVQSTDNDPDRQQSVLENLPEIVRGVALFPVEETKDESYLLRLNEERFRVVMVHGDVTGQELDYVGSNSHRSGFYLTKHLRDHGYEDIAFFGNKGYHYGVVTEKIRGYRDAMEIGGQSFDRGKVFLCELKFDDPHPDTEKDRRLIQQTFEKLLALKPMPRAVLVSNYRLLEVVSEFLHAQGIKVPRQLALATFGHGQPDISKPAEFTAMRVQYGAIAEAAVHLLLRSFDNPAKPVERMLIADSFVLGTSCGKH